MRHSVRAHSSIFGTEYSRFLRADTWKTKVSQEKDAYPAYPEGYFIGRGIVAKVNSNTSSSAFAMAHTLRDTLNSSLPIQFFYMGPRQEGGASDMSQAELDVLESIDGVECVNLMLEKTVKRATTLVSDFLQPYAIVFSRFEGAGVTSFHLAGICM